MDIETPLLILLVLGFLVGAIAAIVCYTSLSNRLRDAEQLIQRLEKAYAEALRHAWFKSRAEAGETPTPPQTPTDKPPTPPATAEPGLASPTSLTPSPSPYEARPVTAAKEAWSSLEVTIGAKWMNWVGVVLRKSTPGFHPAESLHRLCALALSPRYGACRHSSSLASA